MQLHTFAPKKNKIQQQDKADTGDCVAKDTRNDLGWSGLGGDFAHRRVFKFPQTKNKGTTWSEKPE